MGRRRAWCALFCLSVACGSSEAGTQEQEREPPPESTGATGAGPSDPAWSGRAGQYFGADGAPHPLECTSDEECMGDTIPDRDQPCCQDPYSLQAYTREYRSWIGGWRAEHCDDVSCPPPPAPSQPDPCSFDVHCVEGLCANSCP